MLVPPSRDPAGFYSYGNFGDFGAWNTIRSVTIDASNSNDGEFADILTTGCPELASQLPPSPGLGSSFRRLPVGWRYIEQESTDRTQLQLIVTSPSGQSWTCASGTTQKYGPRVTTGLITFTGSQWLIAGALAAGLGLYLWKTGKKR